MISIIQNSINQGYLHWMLTESGPVIMNYGLIKHDKDISFNHLYSSILNKVQDEEKIFSFSINSQSLLYNQSENIYQEDVSYTNWIENEFELNKSDIKYKIYSYPFNRNKLLNVYYPENISNNIFEYVSSKNSSIKSISAGIFSAESACRVWHKSKLNQFKNYLVWKSDSKYDQVLYIENNEFKVLLNFKTLKSKIEIIQSAGDSKDILKVKNAIEICLYTESKKNINVDCIFIYQINKINNKVKFLLNKSNIKNIFLLSPFEVFKSIDKPLENKYILSCFAESGNSFGAIDV